MYGPGSYPPHYGYPPYPPQSGIVYVPVPTPGKGSKGRKMQKMPKETLIDQIKYVDQVRKDLEALLKSDKKDEKKDDKPKQRTFTLLETVGLNFIFMLPTTLILFLLLKAFAKAGGLN